MKNKRAFGRILWRKKDILAFRMVNDDSQQFLIYAEPLITMFDNPESYVRVKKKDNPTNEGSLSYYSGEV